MVFLELVDPDGLTTHVLNYANYDLKRKVQNHLL